MPQRNTAAEASSGRHAFRATFRAFAPALTLGLAGLTVACADGPTAPAAAPVASAAPAQAFVPGPHRSLSTATTTVDLLPSLAPKMTDSSVSFVVQPGGTVWKSPDGAATVSFPSGFVAQPTLFTITRKAGAVIGFDFQPSGTFSKPVLVKLDLTKSAWATSLGTLPVQGAYVRSWSQVGGSTAAVDELVPTTVDKGGKTATLTLSHFSGYLLSTGRR